MNEKSKYVNDIVKSVEKDFSVSKNNSLIPSTESTSLEEFRQYLISKIKFLLDQKYDVLINILYRIDISERKLNELFNGKNKDAVPADLADLIIERQLEKIRLRELYRNGKL